MKSCQSVCEIEGICDARLSNQYFEEGRDSIVRYANKDCVVQCSKPSAQPEETEILQHQNITQCVVALSHYPHPNIAKYFCSNFNYNPVFVLNIHPRTLPAKTSATSKHFTYSNDTISIDTVMLLWLIKILLEFYQARLDQTTRLVAQKQKKRGKQIRYREDQQNLVSLRDKLIGYVSLSSSNQSYPSPSLNSGIVKMIQKYLLVDQLPNINRYFREGINFYIVGGYKVKYLTTAYPQERLHPTMNDIVAHQIASVQERGVLLLSDYYQYLRDRIPTEVFISKLTDLMCGMLHLHDLGFAHTDLHFKNIMIFNEGKLKTPVLKLIDLSNVQYINRPPLQSGAPFLLTPKLLQYWYSRKKYRMESWYGVNRQQDLFGLACLISIAITIYTDSHRSGKTVLIQILESLWGDNSVFTDSDCSLPQLTKTLIDEIQKHHYLPKGLTQSIKGNPALVKLQKIGRNLARCEVEKTQVVLEGSITSLTPYYAPHPGSQRILFYSEYTCPPIKSDINFIKQLLPHFDKIVILPGDLEAKQIGMNQKIWGHIARQYRFDITYWNWGSARRMSSLTNDYLLICEHYCAYQQNFGLLSELHYVVPYQVDDPWKRSLRIQLQHKCPVELQWRTHLLQRDLTSAETHEKWSELIGAYQKNKTSSLATTLTHYIPESIGLEAVDTMLAMVFSVI